MHSGCQQDLVIVFDGEIFKGLNDLGEEGVGDFRNDQSEDAAAAEDEGASLGVRVVAEFIDNSPNSFSELGIHRRNTVNRPGYGCGGDFCPPGDLTNVHGVTGKDLSGTILAYVLGVVENVFYTCVR